MHGFLDSYLWNLLYKDAYCLSLINAGFASQVDFQHRWSVFTMYWPQLVTYALVGKE